MPHSSFFWRLLTTFILCGLLPLFLLSVVFTSASRIIIDKNNTRRAQNATEATANIVSLLFLQAQQCAQKTADCTAVQAWCSGASSQSENSILISDIFQKTASFADESLFQLFIVPASSPSAFQSPTVLSKQTVPDEYNLEPYRSWGILNKAAAFVTEASNSSTTSLDNEADSAVHAVFFGQPHPSSGESTVAATAVPVVYNGKIVGFVIVDIMRKGFAARIAEIGDIQSTLNNLFISDNSGCILYSHFSPDSETTFLFDMNKSEGTMHTSTDSAQLGLVVTAVQPLSGTVQYIRDLRITALIIALVTGVLSLVLAFILSRSIARPVQQLAHAMQQAENGDLSARCPEPDSHTPDDEMAFLIRRFNRMVGRINTLLSDTITQQKLLRTAEIKALQAQIHPHFLYNTLNSIKSMAKLAGENTIASMVTNLGKILRMGFTPGEDFSSIEESLELVRVYFAIESSRWENRFTLKEDIDPHILDYPLPRLVIQPIAENALLHGLEEKQGNGTLSIRGSIHGGEIRIEITDDGDGISTERMAELNSALRRAEENIHSHSTSEPIEALPQSNSNGIALVNTHQRLRLLYGSPYGLCICSQEKIGTTITICVPANKRTTGGDNA